MAGGWQPMGLDQRMEDYTVERKLGSGAQGTTYECVRKRDKCRLVIKQVCSRTRRHPQIFARPILNRPTLSAHNVLSITNPLNRLSIVNPLNLLSIHLSNVEYRTRT